MVNVTFIDSCEQAICVKTEIIGTNISFIIIVVYGCNSQILRKSLWDFLSKIVQQCNEPLLISGDFNSVLLTDDRLNGGVITSTKIRDFEQCIQTNELFQVNTVGAYYTWCNNQLGSDRIVSRIDRCLANHL